VRCFLYKENIAAENDAVSAENGAMARHSR
jgi:hypothetical protein